MAGATLGASAVLAGNAQAAATWVVDTNGDASTSCDSTTHHCPTLRDALAAVSDGDTITFDSSLSGQTIMIHGALNVNNAVTIDGSTAPGLTVSEYSNDNDRVFYVGDAAGSAGVTINGLTMENGYYGGSGGAIYNENNAPLTLTNDTVKDSSATANGGGIFTNGPLTLTGTTVTNNTSKNNAQGSGGGGIAGTADLKITDSHIDGNHAKGSLGDGGGILVQSGVKLSLTGSTVSGNDARFAGGGISDKYGNAAIETSTISGNTAGGAGGVLIGYPQGGPRVNARPNLAVIAPSSDPVTIDKTTISGNQAGTGAGVAIEQTTAGMPVTISASTLSGNPGPNPQHPTTSGGGIEVDGPAAAPIEVIDSTLSGNTANHGAGVGVGSSNGNGLGGPFDTIGNNKGSLSFDNTTIDSNSASDQNGGGGIYLGSYYTPDTDVSQTATVALNSSVVAGNTASGSGNDLSRHEGSSGSKEAGGFNTTYSLIQSPGNAPLLTNNQDILNVDAQLGALADNGGPTQTMLPADTSPVIDQGKAASGLSTDQRGDARTVDRGKTKPPGGDGTDIGAVELPAIVKPGSSATSAPPVITISAIVGPASGITMSQATLNGKINTNGVAVTWHFQWGQTTSYGQTTPSQSISAGHGQVPVSFRVSGLKPGTVYHYRVVAVGSGGQTATSGDARFKTPAPTIKDHPSTVFAGHKTRVFGSAGGCPVGDRVTLMSDAFSGAHQFAGVNAIYATVRPGDRYSVMTTIPAGRAPDRYAITGRCGGGNFGVTAYLRVLQVKHVKAIKVTFTG